MKKLDKTQIYYGKELENLLGTTFGEIQAMIQKNDYVIENPDNFKAYLKFNYKSSIGNSSKRSIKRLNRCIRLWTLKGNREAANRLLHFLKTRLTAKRTDKKEGNSYYSYIRTIWTTELETVKIQPSVKELLIQKKREEWKKMRDAAYNALQAYKKEKGDFYKAQMYDQIQRKKELELVA